MSKQPKNIPGINIQWPWSQLIAEGKKTVETRSYPIPAKYIDKDLALIETPGPKGKKEAGIERARIIGIVRFSGCFPYSTKDEWQNDTRRHCVPRNDPQFRFCPTQPKWGWLVAKFSHFRQSLPAPKKRGIIFASKCIIR